MRSSRLLLSRLAMVALLLLFLSQAVNAELVSWTFTGSKAANTDPNPTANFLSASVEFLYDTSAETLMVVLKNTASNVDYQQEVLTAVFFDVVDSNPSGWIRGTAIADGAVAIGTEDKKTKLVTTTVLYPAGKDVSSEWAFSPDIRAVTQDQGISSAGFAIFGENLRFDTDGDLDVPEAPNGVNFGIVNSSWGEAGDSYQPGLLDEPLIRGSVTFTFFEVKTFLPDATDSIIDNVRFQYGTVLSDPSISGDFNDKPPQVPEPATLIALLGMALTGVGFRVTRRMRAK